MKLVRNLSVPRRECRYGRGARDVMDISISSNQEETTTKLGIVQRWGFPDGYYL